MKLPKVEKCKCCKIHINDYGKTCLCCEPPYLEYLNTTCEERRIEHPEQCKEIFDRSELSPYIPDTIYKEKVKEVVEEWSDMYHQEPIERDYLSDVQKDRLYKLLIKEIDKYFHSGKTRMSYEDAIKIEEIIVKVLNGE